ncbi:MAG: Hsp20/alpha crystallin family protein [Chloroflexota bacterium]
MGGLAVNVYKTARYVIIDAGLPRCLPENIHVTLTSDQLLIEAERHLGEESFEAEEREYLVQELPHGAISRVIPLPNVDIAIHSAEAHFANGMLIVTIPMTEWDARLRHMLGKEVPQKD